MEIGEIYIPILYIQFLKELDSIEKFYEIEIIFSDLLTPLVMKIEDYTRMLS